MGKKKTKKQKKDVRQRIFEIIQIGSRKDIPSFAFDAALITIVILNILSLILESFEQLSYLSSVFKFLDVFSIIFLFI